MTISRRQMLGLIVGALLAIPSDEALAKRGRRGRGRGNRHRYRRPNRRGRRYFRYRDHYEAWRARGKRNIRPLSEIIAKIYSVLPGDVLDVELRRNRGRWLYEVKMLSRQGAYYEVTVDARTKAILRIKEQ